MSKEYIEKEDVKDILEHAYYGEATMGELLEAIDSAVPAKVKPVVMGEWLIIDESYWRATQSQDKQINRVSLKCSNCGHRITRKDFRGVRNYCPNCGADMRKEDSTNE